MFLPKDARLSFYIDECVEEFRSEIGDIQTRLQDSIFSADYKFKNPIELLAFSSLAEQLQGLLEEQDGDVRTALYRGMLFAHYSLFIAHGESVQFDFSTYLAGYLGDEDRGDRLISEVSDYLEDSPAVDKIIVEYMAELDESGLQQEYVTLSAGMIFMFGERSYGEQYLSSQEEVLFRNISQENSEE